MHSHNEQMIDRNLVVTDATVDLNEDEPLGIVADGYLVHLPAAVESTEQLESVLAELDPTRTISDEK